MIITKYLGWTEKRGPRISVRDTRSGKRAVFPRNDDLLIEVDHERCLGLFLKQYPEIPRGEYVSDGSVNGDEIFYILHRWEMKDDRGVVYKNQVVNRVWARSEDLERS
jgi:hypothetical protein